jgi:hypothetical protein
MQWGGSNPVPPGAPDPIELILMSTFAALQFRVPPPSTWQCVVLSGAFFAVSLACSSLSVAQSTSPGTQQPHVKQPRSHKASAKQQSAPAQVPQTPAPPPVPDWPVNDKPNPASVVWDATGLRINASNASLQQILSEVSTETGTKVEGMGADLRVYGNYGPGQARDVISQLLQGSGYNVLLAGDIGHGAPREIVLSPRQSRSPSAAPNSMNRPQPDGDEDISEQPEEQPQPQAPVQPPQTPNSPRPGFGPNGPVRTPQQVMEEMQQRQLLQQQQMQQQQNPQQ